MSPPLPDSFGNYAIRGIAEVVAPDPVSWAPVAAGWKVLGAGLALCLLMLAIRAIRRWRRNRYRRDALRELDKINPREASVAVARMAVILKSTALAAHPRSDVAALSGQRWLDWLQSATDRPAFGETAGALLAAGQYRKPADPTGALALKRDCAEWIRHHRNRPA